MKTPKKNGLEFYSVSYLKSRKNPVRVLRYYWRIYLKGRIIAACTEDYSSLRVAKNNVLSTGIMIAGVNTAWAIQEVERAADAYKNRKR